MQSINVGFQSLRSLLPHHEGEKLSKVRAGFYGSHLVIAKETNWINVRHMGILQITQCNGLGTWEKESLFTKVVNIGGFHRLTDAYHKSVKRF